MSTMNEAIYEVIPESCFVNENLAKTQLDTEDISAEYLTTCNEKDIHSEQGIGRNLSHVDSWQSQPPSEPARNCCQKVPIWAWLIVVMTTTMLITMVIGISWYLVNNGNLDQILGGTSQENSEKTTPISTTPTTPTTPALAISTTTPITTTPRILTSDFLDCQDAKLRGNLSETINIAPDSGLAFTVACDHTTAGGGWTIIQRRENGLVSFNQSWDAYKNGFGSLSGTFWLGNDKIHRLTYNQQQALMVTMEEGGTMYTAYYGSITVSDEMDFYWLNLQQFREGDIGNAMVHNNNKPFTTYDMDRDDKVGGNCAQIQGGGWWHENCGWADINAAWGHRVRWYSIAHTRYILPTKVRMMVRNR